MRHCGFSNTLDIWSFYLSFQMKLKNSGQRKSWGTLLTAKKGGGLGSVKANEIPHASCRVIHTGSRLNHTWSRVLNSLFVINIAASTDILNLDTAALGKNM